MRTFPVLLALLVVAGCGARESDLEGSDEAPTDAGSSRVEMTSGPGDLGFSATGSIDYAHDIGELVITSESMEIPGGEMRGRFVGRTSYVGFNLLGKMRWQKDPESEVSGTDRFIPGPGGPDPDRVLELLTKFGKEVETLDTEEIRGVKARHYRAHLDAEKLGLDESYPRPIVVEAWIDEDGLVRRLLVPQGGDEPIVVDVFDFGVDVDVEAPAATEIVTQEELDELVEKECGRMPREKQRKSIFCEEFLASIEPSDKTWEEAQKLTVKPK